MSSHNAWPMKPLEELVDILDYRRVPVKASERATRTGTVPYYGATGRAGTIDKAIFDEPLVLLGEDGAPFLDPYKPKAYLVDGPSWVNNHAHVLRPGSLLSRRFLRYYLDQFDYRGFANGTTRLKLTQAAMRSIPVPLPSVSEQRRIVDTLEDHLSRIEAATRTLKSLGRRTGVLRKALHKAAFDSLDAPAVRLLDVAVIANGQTPKGLAATLRPEGSEDTVPFFKVGDMNSGDGRLMSGSRTFVSRGDAKALGLHVRGAGTLLIPKRGGAIATNKKRLLTAEAAYDLNVMGIVPSKALLPAYLWHWFQGVDLARLADGSNVPQINAPQVRALNLPVPSLEAQGRLAERLDAAYAAIDRLEGELLRADRVSASLTASLLRSAFAGRLSGPTENAPKLAEPHRGRYHDGETLTTSDLMETRAHV